MTPQPLTLLPLLGQCWDYECVPPVMAGDGTQRLVPNGHALYPPSPSL